METRPIWEGTISFGLVQIPVGLHAAESRDELDFDLLDRRDMAPIGHQRFNRLTDEPVDRVDIVKAYEYAPGQYVTLEPEDFKRANVKATRTVDIVQFTDADELDVMYFEKPYYLVPDKRGEKAYVLLREVLRRSGKVGIARVVIRTRESLAAVMVRGPALILELLRFDHELRKPEEFALPTATARQLEVLPAELAMAERLVDDMDAPFEPAQFKDTYRDDLLAFIHRKVEAGDTEQPPELPVPEPEATNVVDIMALLRRSLSGKPGAEGEAANAAPRPRSAARHASKKPASKKTAAKSVAPRKIAARTATNKTATKKAASKKAVSKKTATKKTAGKKTATKETATRKPGRPTRPRALPAARRAG